MAVLYRLFFFLIVVLCSAKASAVSLSADVNGVLNYDAYYSWGKFTIKKGEQVEWLFTFKLENDSTTTTHCPAGLTYITEKFSVEGQDATNYGGCVYYAAVKNNTGSDLSDHWTNVISKIKIKNNKSFTQKVRLRQFRNKVEIGQNITYTIPANSSCAATVDNLSIGTIRPGTSKSINLPFTITGAASSKSLVISGADIQSDGKLNLGGSASGVKVYPASTYISGSKWNAGSSSGSMLLTIDTNNAKVGLWSSSMLATLTCS